MTRTEVEEHLKYLLEIEAERRPIDAALRSPVVDARDALLCAASNLECGQPQAQPSVAAKLRVAADLLVELDMAHCELHTLKAVLRLGRAPQLQRMAKMLLHIAGEFAAGNPNETVPGDA